MISKEYILFPVLLILHYFPVVLLYRYVYVQNLIMIIILSICNELLYAL